MTALARVGRPQDQQALERAIEFLRKEQERRRLVVRPLGHQLHLRHLVGAHGVCAGAASARMTRRCGARVDWLMRVRTPTAAGARATTATPAAATGGETTRQHSVPDRLGAARADGGRAGADRRRAARRRISAAHAAGRTACGVIRLHRARIPAGVLSEVPRLLRLFPALGAGGISQPRAARSRSLALNVVGIVCALAAEARHLGSQPSARACSGHSPTEHLSRERNGQLGRRRQVPGRSSTPARKHSRAGVWPEVSIRRCMPGAIFLPSEVVRTRRYGAIRRRSSGGSG